MATETLFASSVVSAGVLTSPTSALGAPDGSYTTNTGNTSWTARFALDNPVNGQANGTHSFTLRVRKISGQTGTPVLNTVNLYVAGSGTPFATDSPNANVTSSSSQDVVINFASTAFLGLTLSDVEIEVVTTAAGGAGSARTPVQLDGITWSGDFTAPSKQGAASGTFSFTGAATGVKHPRGSASGTSNFAGVASGTTSRRGSSTGSFTFTGGAAGTSTFGNASGSFSFTGTAAGESQPKGSATGTFTFSGDATGLAPVIPVDGAASGTFTFIGGASGERPRRRFSPPTHEEPIRTNVKPLMYYRLTYANSIVRVNGVLRSMRTPPAELVKAAGEEGRDFFRGGAEYEVDDDTALELIAAGFMEA